MKLIIPTKKIITTFLGIVCIVFIFFLGFFANSYISTNQTAQELLSPFVDSGILINKPLETFSIPNLQKRVYEADEIALEKILVEEETYTSFLFSYKTEGKKMTGQINIPDNITANPEQKKNAIILIRGFVPPEIYETGVGTKNAAASFATAGYITIAPDFFGFGESDPEPEDSWQTRFEKPINIIELLNSIEKNGIPLNLENERTNNTFDLDTIKVDTIGMWAHSNGGQIALTTLEILKKPIPTSLWAPVTVPFPYSILYFSDELEDEGKSQRKWVSLFEETYDVFDFSLTKHLDSLTGPIQIQHGDADDAALIYWSEEFVEKVKEENEKRAIALQEELKENSATASTNASEQKDAILEPVEINLITYPNTNHNMVPSWNIAIQKDLQFFNKWLRK